MKLLATIVCLIALSGCADLSKVVEQRQKLYAPAQVQGLTATGDALKKAIAHAKAEFERDLDKRPAIAQLVDTGIAEIDANCYEWFETINLASERWQQGRGNIGVMQGLLSGGAAAAGFHRDFLTVLGLGSAAWVQLDENFQASALAMSDPILQARVREAMAARARDLRQRGETAQLSYAGSLAALRDYRGICTVAGARQAVQSAIGATQTTVTAAGTLTSTPK